MFEERDVFIHEYVTEERRANRGTSSITETDHSRLELRSNCTCCRCRREEKHHMFPGLLSKLFCFVCGQHPPDRRVRRTGAHFLRVSILELSSSFLGNRSSFAFARRPTYPREDKRAIWPSTSAESCTRLALIFFSNSVFVTGLRGYYS